MAPLPAVTSGGLRAEEQCGPPDPETLWDAHAQNDSEELLKALPVFVERRVGHVSSQQLPQFSGWYYEFQRAVGVFLQEP